MLSLWPWPLLDLESAENNYTSNAVVVFLDLDLCIFTSDADDHSVSEAAIDFQSRFYICTELEHV